MSCGKHIDPIRKHAPNHLGRVLVLGLGKSGKAAASYLLEELGGRVESVTVAAGDRTDDALAFASIAESRGARVLFDHRVITEAYDLCIVSPGIPQSSPFYESAAAASVEIISEVELAWRESPAESRWIAVTGTNGKTTVTSLIAHILKRAGLRAEAVGNIGDTCIEAVMRGGVDVFVAETSSYQLASTRLFAPDIAVLLNITPDHLKWHGTFDAYRDAKLKVLAHLADIEGAVAVLDAVDPVVRETVKRLKEQSASERGYDYIPLGAASGLSANMRHVCGSENAAYLNDDVLTVEVGDIVYEVGAVADLQLKGSHNASNALVAAAVALTCGLDSATVEDGLHTFTPLEHRIEPCGYIEGVSFYNDSKATNVDAALRALDAFGTVKPIVLLGGDDKGTDLADLVSAAEWSCKAVVCFGAAAPRFLAAFSSASVPVYGASALESALDVAISHAQEGDVIVLSPACASFDEFASYEERGRVFKSLVHERANPQGAV